MKNLCKIVTKSGKVCKKYKQKNCENCFVHNVCSICFETCSKQTKLNCGHFYCQHCISKWVYYEENDTCPLCRTVVTNIEYNNAFYYCLYNKLISVMVFIEYNITDNELKEYIEDLVPYDNNFYNVTNWNLIVDYIKQNEIIYNKFFNCGFSVFHSYVKFDENNPGINVNGKNYVYSYKLKFI